MSCRRSSRFWGLGCPKIFHEIEDSLEGHGPQVLACLRNAVIGLLRRLIRQPRQSIASMIRHFAAHPAQALTVFLR